VKLVKGQPYSIANSANGNSQINSGLVQLHQRFPQSISVDFLLKCGNTYENSKIVSTLVQNISPILQKFPKKYNQSFSLSWWLWAFKFFWPGPNVKLSPGPGLARPNWAQPTAWSWALCSTPTHKVYYLMSMATLLTGSVWEHDHIAVTRNHTFVTIHNRSQVHR